MKIGNGLDTVNAAATASGIPGEQVEGTLTWYGDSARTQALGDSYLFQGSDGATVTLYWTFTPDESATNYDRTPVNGSTEFTLTEKLIPTLQVEPLSKTYDGKAVVLDDLQKKADVAGSWSFDETRYLRVGRRRHLYGDAALCAGGHQGLHGGNLFDDGHR